MRCSNNVKYQRYSTLGNDATLILGDSERLPFEDSSFDAIVCNDSFHHYPQPDIVEKEVSSIE
ncbi:TPA: class I SAM-dependent methyltransferase [Clostridioides difficile]